MNFSADITELKRRVAALEANPAPSLRYCKVTNVSASGHARVQLLDGDGMVSLPLRTLQRRTLKDKDQCFPDQGEHVACLFAGQGMESGVILGAMYSDVNQPGGEDTHFGYYQYEDGTVIYYDRKAHKLYAHIQGEVDIIIEKDAKVHVKGEATVDVDKNATVRSKQMLVMEGHAGVRMRGPSIIFEGISGGACDAAINADLKIQGLVDHRGNQIHTGDTQQTGNQSTTGDISATGTVSGNPVVGCNC